MTVTELLGGRIGVTCTGASVWDGRGQRFIKVLRCSLTRSLRYLYLRARVFLTTGNMKFIVRSLLTRHYASAER